MAASIAALSLSATAADITWENKTGDWTQVELWNGGVAPGSEDVASFKSGEMSITNAVQLSREKVAGLVLWAAAAVLKDDAISGYCMFYHCGPGDPPEIVADLGGGRYLGREFILTARMLPIYETAAQYRGGACVINGGSDVVVPVRYGKRFHGVLVGSSFHLLPEEDHNFGHDYKSSIAIGANYLVRVLTRP